MGPSGPAYGPCRLIAVKLHVHALLTVMLPSIKFKQLLADHSGILN